MGNEQVATYYYQGLSFHVYGCWDKETPEGAFDFYDIYVNNECINLGEPWYEFPTRDEVIEFYKQ
jgi:hypothetical protein